MSTTFSVVMTVFRPFELLPRALSCLAWQEHPHWELLMVVDGPAPKGTYEPRRLAQQMHRRCPNKRIELCELPRAPACYGNVGRNFALRHARGDYVCWINHDNLVTPQYLAAHAENVAASPGCLSVVDVDLWQKGCYHGRYPRGFTRSRIDLLCFAVPLETARAVDAFGGNAARVYAADWLTFDACRKRCPVRHNRRLVGVHF